LIQKTWIQEESIDSLVFLLNGIHKIKNPITTVSFNGWTLIQHLLYEQLTLLKAFPNIYESSWLKDYLLWLIEKQKVVPLIEYLLEHEK
jgi:hypothetical protein